MMVFKLSWLPYILIIVGISFLCEGQAVGILFIMVGGGWLLGRHNSKKSSTNTVNPPINRNQTGSATKNVNNISGTSIARAAQLSPATKNVNNTSGNSIARAAQSSPATKNINNTSGSSIARAAQSSPAAKMVNNAAQQTKVSTPAVMRCGSCGAEISKDDVFCYKCGNRITSAPSIIRCSSCGSEVSKDAVYCHQCGNKISGR